MMGGFLTWDLVTLMSIAGVLVAIGIAVFLGFKVVELMNRDADSRRDQDG
ncbi:hypothetical protein [Thiorhodococcus fuscus]|uniref:DUF3149 domain-containing protein n=1 Tax=Thiorhodococcus fuscus TaxID=527200 RepID=A0ABW4YBY1_9GAMM